MKKLVSILLFLITISTSIYAKEQDDVTFQDEIKIDRHLLKLNGTGTRVKTFFKVKVYAAGLYLEKKSNNSDSILESPQIKRLNLYFLHNVPEKKIVDVWTEDFEKACDKNCEYLKTQLKQLTSALSDLSVGDTINLTFYPDSLLFQIQDHKPIKIEGKEFQKTILAIWIGPNSVSSDLKDSLLGLQKK